MKGVHPYAVAVAKRARRVFVVGDGIPHASIDPTVPGVVAMLDARTGRLLRTLAFGHGLYPYPIAVDNATGRVFIPDYGNGVRDMTAPLGPGRVITLDARTGRVLRTTTVGVGPVAVAVDERSGRVFVLNHNDRYYGQQSNERGSVSVLDARTGLLLRTVAVGGSPSAVAIDTRLGHAFVIVSDMSVAMLDATSGALLKRYAIFAPVYLAVDELAGRAVVYAGSGDRSSSHVIIVDERRGRIVANIVLQGLASGIPQTIVVDALQGHALVYAVPPINQNQAFLYLIDVRGGRIVRQTVAPCIYCASTPGVMAVDASIARALLLLDNRVVVVDTKTGRLLRTVVVRDWRTSVLSAAVDPVTHRAFLVSADDGKVTTIDLTNLAL